MSIEIDAAFSASSPVDRLVSVGLPPSATADAAGGTLSRHVRAGLIIGSLPSGGAKPVAESAAVAPPLIMVSNMVDGAAIIPASDRQVGGDGRGVVHAREGHAREGGQLSRCFDNGCGYADPMLQTGKGFQRRSAL